MKIFEGITKELDLWRSRKVPINSIKTVCLALGPYRNLTTLTGAVLFLHPNCQVLNHAGRRVLGDRRTDFLKQYSDASFDNFVRYAIHISTKGRSGPHGGSIVHSHAFGDEHKLPKLFQEHDLSVLKDDIHTLFWKESLRTANHIRQNNVDLVKIFAQNKRLKFLMPIRNPLDCAVSNVKTGHVHVFPGRNKNSTVPECLDSILDEFAWFRQHQTRNPDRFHCFFEHDLNHATMTKLAQFLGLAPITAWVSGAAEAFEMKSKYSHQADLVTHFRQGVQRRFAADPAFADKLLRFSPPQQQQTLRRAA